MKKIMIYQRFERFWHWCQAALIFFLMFTGFEIHGSYQVLGADCFMDFSGVLAVHNRCLATIYSHHR